MAVCDCRQAAGQKHLVGFCFSFPCEQERLDRGKLIKWTKQFDNEGAVGEDPVKLLQEALHRKGLQVTLPAVVPSYCRSGSVGQHADQKHSWKGCHHMTPVHSRR